MTPDCDFAFKARNAITSKTLTLTDVNKVSYTPSPTAVTVGTGTKSVDATLTTSGVNQYANEPTIGMVGNNPSNTRHGIPPDVLVATTLGSMLLSRVIPEAVVDLGLSASTEGTVIAISEAGGPIAVIAEIVITFAWNYCVCHGQLFC